ncbi:hypothetical protein [Cronobacter phage vB_CtuP_B1]|nr:hypothetical protein [Cronobacter phage vB_CtuP_B1]
MKDFLGQEVSVGDKVVYTEYNREALLKGEVIGFNGTGSQAVVKTSSHWKGETKKTSGYIVVIEKAAQKDKLLAATVPAMSKAKAVSDE